MKVFNVGLNFTALVVILFSLAAAFVFIPFTVITRNTINEVRTASLELKQDELNTMAQMAYNLTLLKNSNVLENLASEDQNQLTQKDVDKVLHSGYENHLLEFIVVKEIDERDISSFAWTSVLQSDLTGYLEFTPRTRSGWYTLNYESRIVLYYVVPLYDEFTGKHYRNIYGGFILNDNMNLYRQISDLTDGNIHNIGAVYKNRTIGYIESIDKDEVSSIINILANNMFSGKYKGVVFNSQVFPEQTNEDLILYAFANSTSIFDLEDVLYRSFLFLLAVLGFVILGIGYFIIKVISFPLGNLASYAENLATNTPSAGFNPGIIKEIKEIGRCLENNVDTIYMDKTRLENTIEATKTGTWEWNVQTGETVFNERFVGMAGYTLAELSPISFKTWEFLAHPDDLRASNEALESHFNGETACYEAECRIKHKEGHWVWVLDRGKVLTRTEDGRPLLVYGTHQDISEHKRAEAEREKLQFQLLQAQKMESVGILAGGVAHDFNNLLHTMRVNIEMLLQGKSADCPETRRLESVTRSMDRAARLVQQLLLFSRKAESGKERVDVNQEVREAAQMLERTIPRMVSLELHLDPDVWPISGDPVQIEQVLINLANNAVDAMPDGGRLTIETANVEVDEGFVRAHPGSNSGRHVLLTVSDTGCGMDREIMDHVFDPFFTTKEVGKGTGLGLASVYGIVKAHGGYIQCYSDPGLGSTFRVYLPAVELGDVAQIEQMPEPLLRGGSETILVVDDEGEIRELTREALELLGYSVKMAVNGEQALDIYREHGQSIDLVLLDLNMPGMGGHKCLTELMRLDPDVKVVIVSGYSANGHGKDTVSSGARGFIGKPYQLQELAVMVQKVLDG